MLGKLCFLEVVLCIIYEWLGMAWPSFIAVSKKRAVSSRLGFFLRSLFRALLVASFVFLLPGYWQS